MLQQIACHNFSALRDYSPATMLRFVWKTMIAISRFFGVANSQDWCTPPHHLDSQVKN
jgi:hypothetical protein